MEFKIDFIGIGAYKSGSTTIGKLLEAHPEICFSVPKEVNYFNSRNAYWATNQQNKNADKPLSWYARHYSHYKSGQIRGEMSNSYLIDQYAAQRIKATFPDIKLICFLRNPVDRCYSEYQMLKNLIRFEKRSFREAISEEPELRENSMYFKHLSRYLDLFDRSQLKIFFFDELKKNPKKVVRELYTFLGVDPDFLPDNIREKSNPARKADNFLHNRIHLYSRLISGWGGGKLIIWLRKMKIDYLINKLLSQPIKYEAMEKSDRNLLKNVFQEDITQLERLVGKDLSHWK